MRGYHDLSDSERSMVKIVQLKGRTILTKTYTPCKFMHCGQPHVPSVASDIILNNTFAAFTSLAPFKDYTGLLDLDNQTLLVIGTCIWIYCSP